MTKYNTIKEHKFLICVYGVWSSQSTEKEVTEEVCLEKQ